MARPSTGTVIAPDDDRQRSFALRFNAYGKRRFLTLGLPEDGWTRDKAEERLRHILADVERGIWVPEEPPAPVEPKSEQTFLAFAQAWLDQGEPNWRARTIADYRWALELHLLPVFGHMTLSTITVEHVDGYMSAKLRESERRQAAIDNGKPMRDSEGKLLRPLSPNAINKTLTRLAQILDLAVEYDRIPKNPAAGKNRRIKGTEPKRTHVEVEQLPALIDAADSYLRPIVATLAGAGLRIGEAVALNWRDVNLSTGTLIVRESKTVAGEGREVDMPVGLQEELATWRARSPRSAKSDPVFVSRKRDSVHSRQTPRNVQARLDTAVVKANAQLAEVGIEPIVKVSPHSLRRTFASILFAGGMDPIYVAEQGGWSNPAFPMRVYAKAARRRQKLSGAHLAAFDRALDWAGVSAGTVREANRAALAESATSSTPNAGNGMGRLESRPVRL